MNDAIKVGVVGGGLAGLAAAAALVERGFRVELFEARRKLGGRAGSYVDPVSGEEIDHCQHVAMGCCTNFLDFCRRTGVGKLLQRYKTLHFFGPDGRRCDFSPSTWLPAPLHLAAVVDAPLLVVAGQGGDRAGDGCVVKGTGSGDAGQGIRRTRCLRGCREQRQTPVAIERFWKVVLVSALADSLDRVSVAAARKVFVDGFLAIATRPMCSCRRFRLASYMTSAWRAGWPAWRTDSLRIAGRRSHGGAKGRR